MARQIIATNDFDRKLKVFIQRHKDFEKKIQRILSLLGKDIYSPILHTHKLSGKLQNLYACNVSYEYRLIFAFDDENLYLFNIGSHDEVY